MAFKISDTFAIQKKMMSLTGVWHRQNSTLLHDSVRHFTTILMSITFAGMIAQGVQSRTNINELCQVLYLVSSYIAYFCKLTGFVRSRKTFLSMLDHLEDPIFTSYPTELEKHLTKTLGMTVLVTKMYRLACFVIICLYIVYPMLDNKTLPTPVPFELGNYTVVMYAIQALGTTLGTSNNLCFDTLCAALMGLASSELDLLKHKIIGIRKYAAEITGRDATQIDDVVTEMLHNCIRHHCAIITFVDQIDEIFSFGLLAQFLNSAVVICSTGFFLLMISPASFQFALLMMYFLTMMTQLFLYCWYGNEILLKSVEVGEGCYLSHWYDCDGRVKKLLIIIMERSKRPLSVTAWKFADLSLTSFSSIIQRSYSYFALLQQLGSTDELS